MSIEITSTKPNVFFSVLFLAAWCISCDETRVIGNLEGLEQDTSLEIDSDENRFWRQQGCFSKYEMVEFANAPELLDRSTTVNAITNRGNACGNMDYTGFYWTKDHFYDLLVDPEPSEFSQLYVRDCNDRGELVGAGLFPSPTGHGRILTAFFWSTSDGLVNINPTASEGCIARSINNHGEVVMECPNLGGLIWTEETGHSPLPVVEDIDVPEHLPLAINNKGIIVGRTRDGLGNGRPSIWSDLMGHWRLEGLGGSYGQANNISDSGYIVGEVEDKKHKTHPVIWEPDGTLVDIGVLPIPSELEDGHAWAVNNSGIAVGSDTGYNTALQAWIWCGGTKTNLNDVVEGFVVDPTVSDGWHANIATDINDDSQIVVWADNPQGVQRAVRLTPVGPPVVAE